MIRHATGDATAMASADPNRPRVLAHIVNDAGGWGKGFVLAVSARFSGPEGAYRWWHRGGDKPPWLADDTRETGPFGLGQVQFVRVDTEGTWVANMVAQRGYRRGRDGAPPIRYDALRDCLVHLSRFALAIGATVHMPRIGTGLAGGRWDVIEPMLVGSLDHFRIDTTVYELP